MVQCCHFFTWSLNKTISFISNYILICKYSSVRKVSVFSIAVRGEDTLKQTRLYDYHLNNNCCHPHLKLPHSSNHEDQSGAVFQSMWTCSTNMTAQFLSTTYNCNIYVYIYLYEKRVTSFFFISFWNIFT